MLPMVERYLNSLKYILYFCRNHSGARSLTGYKEQEEVIKVPKNTRITKYQIIFNSICLVLLGLRGKYYHKYRMQ